MGRRRFPLRPYEILESVGKYLTKRVGRTKFKGKKPSYGWLEKFLGRHPELKKATAKSLELKRAKVGPEELERWYREYTTLASDLGVINKPAQIFNVDESGFAFKSPPPKTVIVGKGPGAKVQVETGGKGTISVLMCGNASGTTIPPFLCLRGKSTELVQSYGWRAS